MIAQFTRLESVLHRDRVIILAGLATITLLAWAYLVFNARNMAGMPDNGMMAHMAMPLVQSWNAVDLLLLFVMWAVMMVAMMVPSVSPLILLFARAQRRSTTSASVGSAAILLVGYLLVWTVFSAVAALTQWRLHTAALLSPMMVSTSSILGGALLIGAGVFQFTPIKRACLHHCRSPIQFVMKELRPGQWWTFAMGVKHGAYCVGCCAVLMGLLLVAGVMNLLWVAVIAAFVLVEKVAPKGELVGRAMGAVLIMGGMTLIVFKWAG